MINAIPILAETSEFWLIDKPAGLGFHAESGMDDEGERTREDGLCQVVERQLGAKVFPVHRLDKMTSGLLLFAKSSRSAARLSQLFEQHQIQKYYLAIGAGKPKKKQGWVKGDMERSRRSSWRLLASQTDPAISQFFSYSLVPGLRLALVKPRTGRTHQIRVAMKSLSMPIAGDTLYQASAQAAQYDRGYLHAYALVFELDGTEYKFVCPPRQGELFLGDECQKLLGELQEPWGLAWP